MKAFFTVTEDSLSRRMGIFKLTFTLYIMCKFINGKGEEKELPAKFYKALMLLVMEVCLCLFVFFS